MTPPAFETRTDVSNPLGPLTDAVAMLLLVPIALVFAAWIEYQTLRSAYLNHRSRNT